MCQIDFDVCFKAAIPAFQLSLEVRIGLRLLILLVKGKQKHLENFLKSCHGGIGMHNYTLYIAQLGGTCTIAHCTNCVTKLFEKLSLVVCSKNAHCTACVTKRSILKSCQSWYAQLHNCTIAHYTLYITHCTIAHCTTCVTKRSSQD